MLPTFSATPVLLAYGGNSISPEVSFQRRFCLHHEALDVNLLRRNTRLGVRVWIIHRQTLRNGSGSEFHIGGDDNGVGLPQDTALIAQE